MSSSLPRSEIDPPAVDDALRRLLVVGDSKGHVRTALDAIDPAAEVVNVATPFDAIAYLGTVDDRFDAVLAAAPSQEREASAVGALRRQLNGSGRLILLGETDAKDGKGIIDDDPRRLRRELQRAFSSEKRASVTPGVPALTAEIILAALTDHPGNSAAAAISALAGLAPAPLALTLEDTADDSATSVPVGDTSRHLVVGLTDVTPDAAERDVLLHDLAALADQLAKLANLDDHHNRLRELATTDELTGCANRRFFRTFLNRILAKARSDRFPVTLLLFDIDDFKQYNDRHGHAVGDAILKQTARLIRRCVRDHDLVARIGGDEFAVVFWEKDQIPGIDDDHNLRRGGRMPKGPLQIAARFRRLLSSPEFAALGDTGVGTLTISGGMSVFPYDASTADELIDAADHALLFNAKRSGKNSIAIVGETGNGNGG